LRLLEAIRQTVQRFPKNIAVEDPLERLTYREMWGEALRVSQRLALGSPGYVLIREPRSCQLIVKLLAVWLAGHAPLLLDPDTPATRVEEIGRRVRPIGGGFQDPRSSTGVEYLVTTSGSSGQPKLVKIGVGSLNRVIQYQITAFQLDQNSSVAWILSPGFDASFSDIGTAMCSGARLVGMESPYPDRLDGITHLDIPPALLQIYQPGDFPSTLRTLVVGGEASRAGLLRAWARHHRLVAVYGPSETTVCSSAAVVDDDWDQHYIGHPVPEVQYAVDQGELLIGGPNVGLGYLDETGPYFFERNGARWYRTGDRVGPAHSRFGHLFLGRLDRQVQLRGQRFEPEEVERRAVALLNTQAACEVWNGQVVLCWQTHGKPCAEEKRLQAVLTEHLMPGWLPQHYLPLEKLPRNEVLKIDRRELRALMDRCLTEQLTSLERLRTNLNGELQARHECRALLKTAPVQRKAKPSLLVTGLTGRLGGALRSLLENQYDVWSLQRTPTNDRSIQADLTAPSFGLSIQDWEFLEREIDEVLYLAGKIDLSLDLESLLPINVDPLSAFIQLRKPLHYASTLAVPLCTDDVVYGGYAQSKSWAEQLLKDTPGLTLRYGHLMMDQPRSDELLAIVVKGLTQLGCCPQHNDPSLCFDWTPIEWAAQRTLQLLNRPLESRYTEPVRKGWHFHLNDLALVLKEMGEVALVDPKTFFRLTPKDRESALAQTALWKCQPTLPTNRAFDLFLLGNSERMLEHSRLGPKDQLAEYVQESLAHEFSR
jgi:acyl-CoA synthetase (AMP-forming)/AMP-acid ligase II/nucleoside-diphosphate-sugar epimerase